jgi:hypothetical protein
VIADLDSPSRQAATAVIPSGGECDDRLSFFIEIDNEHVELRSLIKGVASLELACDQDSERVGLVLNAPKGRQQVQIAAPKEFECVPIGFLVVIRGVLREEPVHFVGRRLRQAHQLLVASQKELLPALATATDHLDQQQFVFLAWLGLLQGGAKLVIAPLADLGSPPACIDLNRIIGEGRKPDYGNQ